MGTSHNKRPERWRPGRLSDQLSCPPKRVLAQPPAPQPSTCTVTLLTLLALGAVTLRRPSR
jgi:MYXO-CTERM domain-containing protein